MFETILGGLEFALWIAFIYALASPRMGVALHGFERWLEGYIERHRP